MDQDREIAALGVPEPPQISPPFDLTADMLFVVAFTRTRHLRDAFPGRAFLSILGRTPLVLWFSTVTEGCYRDGIGRRNCLGGPGERLYDEVTVMAMLRRRVLFSPAIYATSELSIQIAKRYAMPKQAAIIEAAVTGDRIVSTMKKEGASTSVDAEARTGGRLLAAIVGRLWPVWSWPVEFPAGTRTQALIQETPKIRAARVREGTLALPVRWLPSPVSFWRFGVFVPQLRMQLPPP